MDWGKSVLRRSLEKGGRRRTTLDYGCRNGFFIGRWVQRIENTRYLLDRQLVLLDFHPVILGAWRVRYKPVTV